MDETAPAIDAATRAALESLADIAMPPPVSLMPHTWGWAVLAIALLALAAWAGFRAMRRYRANRYRREALALLAGLERTVGDPARRAEALAAVPALVKRTALAAWPREAVASLSGGRWGDFLHGSVADDTDVEPIGRLIDDVEYRGLAALAAVADADARACLASARRWIEKHHVPA